jgi:Tfp pilus assembly protein PilO
MKVRNKYVLIMALVWGPCLVLAVLFYLFVLAPQMQRVVALEAELVDVRGLYSQATEAAKKENQVRLTEAVDEIHHRVSDFVLRLETAPDLAFEIANLANETQVGSFAMKPQGNGGSEPVVNCEWIGQKQIDVRFTSHYEQFATLLNALERHRPVLFVETFAIHHPLEEATRPQAEMQLAVLVEKPRDG